MAYNEKLADRIRMALVHLPKAEEKLMFGGVCFMVKLSWKKRLPSDGFYREADERICFYRRRGNKVEKRF